MKKAVIKLFSICVLIGYSFWASANSTVRVNYTGVIKPGTCSVQVKNPNIDLGLWFLYELDPKKSWTDWVEFDVQFNCNSRIQSLYGTLQGNQSRNAFYFALDEGDDTAQGIVLHIESYSVEKNWETMRPNSSTILLTNKDAQEPSGKIRFRARYYLLGKEQTGGIANASVTLVLENK